MPGGSKSEGSGVEGSQGFGRSPVRGSTFFLSDNDSDCLASLHKTANYFFPRLMISVKRVSVAKVAMIAIQSDRNTSAKEKP